MSKFSNAAILLFAVGALFGFVPIAFICYRIYQYDIMKYVDLSSYEQRVANFFVCLILEGLAGVFIYLATIQKKEETFEDLNTSRSSIVF
jgi:hypothetical protein